MSNNYKTVELNLSTIEYKIIIDVVSPDYVNDKFTYFTRERGMIPETLYEDYIIATFVSNITDLIHHLQSQGINSVKMSAVRREVIDKVIEINPILDPSNVIINANNVVKLKTDDQIKDGEMSLSSNPMWSQNNYTSDHEKLATDKIQNVKDLPYTKIQKFWRRIGSYVTIKQFEPGAELIVLANRIFSTRFAFEQYIVTICVEEVEDLFVRLDKVLQLSQRVQPPILIHELYELCRKSNPFLDYDVYKESTQVDRDQVCEESCEDCQDPFEQAQQATPGGLEEALAEAQRSKKRLKTFRDVEKSVLVDLSKSIKKKVIGQGKAIDDLVDSIQRASVGLKDPEVPIGSFIFTGSTGIGKSYTAKVLAEELVGNRHSLVVVDCSEYSADHEYSKLIGAPSGYIGHEQGGYLTNALRKNPFAVVLFDEIEKASPKVHQLLLQIMDEGRLTDGKGAKVSFKDAVIVMTSNLGVKESVQIEKTIGFGNVSCLTDEKKAEASKTALKKEFKPEFLNRITGIINFCSLSKENYIQIIGLELDKLKTYLKVNNTPYSRLSLRFDKSLREYIYKAGIDEKYGARPLQRAIEREISTPLAKKLLQEDVNCNTTLITVSVKKGKVVFNTSRLKKEKTDSPPFYMEAGHTDE